MEESQMPLTLVKEKGWDINGSYHQNQPLNNPQQTSTLVMVAQQRASDNRSRPSSCLWLSMIACCFCWPMAICAIVLSNQSTYAAGAGDYTTAKEKGRTAMGIALGAIAIGIIIIVGYILWLKSKIDNSRSYGYY